MPYKPNGTFVESEEEYIIRLLKRASDTLQSYCANENGDMNDPLAMEIDRFVEKMEKRGIRHD